jgi:hypothetical protein
MTFFTVVPSITVTIFLDVYQLYDNIIPSCWAVYMHFNFSNYSLFILLLSFHKLEKNVDTVDIVLYDKSDLDFSPNWKVMSVFVI